MIVVTTETIPGKEIVKIRGVASGNSVRDMTYVSKGAILKSEAPGYAKELSVMREEALMLLIEDAKQKGANAVVGLHFVSTSLLQYTVEVAAYGTAVKAE